MKQEDPLTTKDTFSDLQTAAVKIHSIHDEMIIIISHVKKPFKINQGYLYRDLTNGS